MYTGTMIDDLIQAVAHAEQQARTQPPAPAARVAPAPAPQPVLLPAHTDSYLGPVVGAA